jgi:hypothetical protein
MRREGVVSVEVARARATGQEGAVCVRVTVRPDAPGADLPTEVDGVPVEVVTGTGPVPEEAPDVGS